MTETICVVLHVMCNMTLPEFRTACYHVYMSIEITQKQKEMFIALLA